MIISSVFFNSQEYKEKETAKFLKNKIEPYRIYSENILKRKDKTPFNWEKVKNGEGWVSWFENFKKYLVYNSKVIF